MRRLILGLLLSMLAFADGPSIFYSKTFPGSTPAYCEITVDQKGAATYREEPGEDPMEFELTPEETHEIFELAAKVNHFADPLEAGLPVAKTGVKVFRWDDGSTKHQVEFNYTTNLDAQALLKWFERISQSERMIEQLEHTARFDKIGVNAVLLNIQSVYNHDRLVAGRQFLPLLDRVAKNASYMNIARKRAAALAAGIRAPKPVGQ